MTDEFTQHSTEMCIDNEETWRSFLYQDMLYFSYNLVHTKKNIDELVEETVEGVYKQKY